MCNSLTKWLWLPLAALLVSCGGDPVPRFGFNTTGIQFEVFDTTEGIHPSDVTLDNPRNPFRRFAIGDDTKFELLGGGNAGAFYAWATLLANVPIGENQYYAAVTLRDIYQANEVPPEQLETVRTMAINAFQAVLDCFPDSVLFDVSGEIPIRLSTLAFIEITELNGVVQGDWVLAEDSRGTATAVRSSGFDTLARDVLCF